MSTIVTETSNVGPPIIPDWNFPDNTSNARQAVLLTWEAQIINNGDTSWVFSDPGKIRIKATGDFTVVCQCALRSLDATFTTGLSPGVMLFIVKNGTDLIGCSANNIFTGLTGSSGPTYINAKVTASFVAGDYIEAYAAAKFKTAIDSTAHLRVTGSGIAPTQGRRNQTKELWGYAFGLPRQARIDRIIPVSSNPSTLNPGSYLAVVPVTDATIYASVGRSSLYTSALLGNEAFKFDAVDFDSGGVFSSPSTFVIPTTKVYIIDAILYTSNATTAQRFLMNLASNFGAGGTLAGHDIGDQTPFVPLTGIGYLEAGATITCSWTFPAPGIITYDAGQVHFSIQDVDE